MIWVLILGYCAGCASALLMVAMRDRKQNRVLTWLCMLVPYLIVLTICLMESSCCMTSETRWNIAWTA